MFPCLQVQLTDLDPLAHYCLMLEMVPATQCRFKYSNSAGWAPAGIEDAPATNRIYVHPDSPATGEYWMSQIVSFGRVKLTNNTVTSPTSHLVLSSMHKYQPKIMLIKTAHPRFMNWAPTKTFVFPETRFIAVTAYQSERITRLKIDNNPFAKGFREGGHSKCKRKFHKLGEDEEPRRQDEPELKKVCGDENNVSVYSSSGVEEQKTVPYSYVPCWSYPMYRFPTSLVCPGHLMNTLGSRMSSLSPNSIDRSRKLTDFSIRALLGPS